MSLRIRQIVLAAADLQRTVDDFQEALQLQVAYRDPAVATFGLANALMTVGDQFIEIVSPTRPDTAVGRHLDRHGDSAYMLILQTDDLSRDRSRLQQLGVRIVWESTHEDICTVHLHPKDIGAAIVSLDQATPPQSWRWAGPHWQAHISPTGARQIIDATISARDPLAMAQRWSRVLGLDAPVERSGHWVLTVNEGTLKFGESTNDREQIAEYTIAAPHRTDAIAICGTRFNFVACAAS